MLIKIPKGWEIPERDMTPEPIYLNRRRFLASMGVAGAAGFALWSGCARFDSGPAVQPLSQWPLSEAEKAVYPARRNGEFTLDRPLTEEKIAATYNNFYEFSSDKDDVYLKAEALAVHPWTVEIGGLVEKPMTVDPDGLLRKMPMEERLYRLRCVEAWAMAVPWTGFPLKALIDSVRPLSRARYLRFTSIHIKKGGNFFTFGAPWPYTEGLTLEEALNPLTLLVTGIYGHPLPKQHGAPLRLIVPWKYGFKSIKSIVRIEFIDTQPRTFWNTMVPDEYDFRANVDPKVPHPRWSQETERMLGTGERRKTRLYNGYHDFVASLYA